MMDPQPVYWDTTSGQRIGKLVAVLPMGLIGFVGVVMTSTGFDIVPLDKLRPGHP